MLDKRTKPDSVNKSTSVLNIVQCNLKKCQLYTQQLLKYADKTQTNLIAVQEPYAFRKDSDDCFQVTGYGAEFEVLYERSKTEMPKSMVAVRRNTLKCMLDTRFTSQNVVVVVFKEFVLISAYLNPDKDIRDDLSTLQSIFDKYSSRKMLLVCDSNARSEIVGDVKTNTRGKEFFDFVLGNEFAYLNDKHQGPTFHTTITINNKLVHKASYVDLSLAKNFDTSRFSWTILDNITGSDHRTIVITLNLESNIRDLPSIRRTINYDKSNWRGFNDHYDRFKPKVDTDFNTVNKSKFNDIFYKFNRTLEIATNKHLKFKTRRMYDSQPWFQDYIDTLCNEIADVRYLLDRAKSAMTKVALNNQLKCLSKCLKQRVRIEKKKYFISLHKVTNTDQFWKVWKKSRISNVQNIPMFENNVSNTFEENIQILSSTFVKSPKYPYKRIHFNDTQGLEPTNADEIQSIICKLDPNKAPGLDNITNKLIKIIFLYDKDYLVRLFNLVLFKVKIPKQWKIGKMIFFAKNNNTIRIPKDLRPITLIIGWCKIVEILFSIRIERKLNEINFFSDLQFGFTKGRSTNDAIDHLVQNIKQKRQSYTYNLLMSIDVSSAFDSVSWKLIITNLLNAGIEPKFVKAVETILMGRKCLIDDKLFECKIGCPQGGSASPLCWRIAMNSLLCTLHSNKRTNSTAFADDLINLISANSLKDIEEYLSETYYAIVKWCDLAELKINLNKTQFMLLGRKRLNRPILLHNNPIKLVNKIKYLGVFLDRELNWKSHLDHLESKINLLTHRLNTFSFLSSEVKLIFKKKLYFSVFVPTILYAHRIWYPDICSKSTYTHRLQIMQRKFLKSLVHAYKCTSTDKLLKILHIVDILEEINIFDESLELEKHMRKDYKNETRDKWLANVNVTLPEELNTDTITHRFTIWCLTDTGPFRAFLYKIGKAENPNCRYCATDNETPTHLLLTCPRFSHIDPAKFEDKCIHIVKTLFIDEH